MAGHTSTSKILVGLEQKSTHDRVQVTNFLEDHGRRILMEPEIGARSLRTVGYAPGLLVGKKTLHSERLLHRLQHYLQRKISNLLSTLTKATPLRWPRHGQFFQIEDWAESGNIEENVFHSYCIISKWITVLEPCLRIRRNTAVGPRGRNLTWHYARVYWRSTNRKKKRKYLQWATPGRNAPRPNIKNSTHRSLWEPNEVNTVTTDKQGIEHS